MPARSTSSTFHDILDELAGIERHLDYPPEEPLPKSFHPKANWFENNSGHSIFVDLPGVEVSDVKVQMIEDSLLVLSGNRKLVPQASEGGKYRRRELGYGDFRRSFSLGPNASASELQARFIAPGLLRLTIPKKPSLIREFTIQPL